MPMIGGGFFSSRMRAKMRRAWIVIVAVLAIAAPTAAQIDVQKIGPQTGAKAIAFELPDQFSRVQRLETVAGPKGTMLVFFRSADW
jgi:hypothetical protein